ncbi:cell surface protein [Vibrio azureus]|uniref:Hint domain-containing protein n=1 Tax=Vibrio azureus NBRC 104587 TaxID=1219077 RepID=U3AMG9_9VIBR|nr:Hint domain-containing protein [Vibrio azureus]AUI87529.1 cell surface protein [Vibrio azureus]GAD74497.1 hypothetical protein VAZ01S_011_00250 [Vibrio azureus NBRC 104587]
MIKKLLALTLGLTSLSISANDGARLEKRCSLDSLSPSQAVGRNEWAHKCKHISKRTMEYNTLDDFDNPRARPLYPSFFNPANFDDWFKAPIVKSGSCDIKHYTKQIHCVSSCYTPDQKILFVDGEHEIYDALTKKLTNIVALSDNASLDNISYQVKDVEAYSESIVETVHNIRVFNTANGGQLKVTDNHPLLVSTGYMLTAENIKVGDSLISKDGSFDEIINIEDVKFTGKVYNVMPDTSDKSTNGQIVVAQGFLSGSMYYQNDGANLTGRLLLRDQIPSDLL